MQALLNILRKYPGIMKLWYALRFKLKGNRIIDYGSNNVIEYGNAYLKGNTFIFSGSNNRIVLGAETSVINCRFRIGGTGNHLLQMGSHCAFIASDFAFEDNNCKIIVGNRTSMQKQSEISAVEAGTSVSIGNDCLLASFIDIRNSDSHSIIDAVTGQRINYGKDIVIEDNVWVGAYVVILKNVTIGKGAVVGIRSVVSKNIPAGTLAIGSPAKPVKENISWKYERI